MRLAFVVQRYGLEINGGAELHCRWIAERLSANHQVEVFTTCAYEYLLWKNHYPEGTEEVNGIPVHQRSHQGVWFQRIANGDLLVSIAQPPGKLIKSFLLDNYTTGGGAPLPGSAYRTEQNGAHGQFHISLRRDYDGIIPAQFEDGFSQSGGNGLPDMPPHGYTARG